jgi:hypothetical protein
MTTEVIIRLVISKMALNMNRFAHNCMLISDVITVKR